jgi:acetyl esterase/lipase
MSVLSLFLSACSPLGAINRILAKDDGVSGTLDIRYGPAPRQRLDVYRPDGSAKSHHPAVIFFYGGSWRRGARADYRFVGQALARRGIVTIIPDYRLYPEVKFPTFVRDAAKVVRWVFNNSETIGIDGDRISVAGHSAGAHIAATLALDGRYLSEEGLRRPDIAGMIGIAGPYAFDPLFYRSTKPIFADVPDIDSARPAEIASDLAVAQTRDDLPTFTLLHGANDTTVLPKNSAVFADALRAAGADVRHTVYEGVGHYRILLAFFSVFENWAPVQNDVAKAVNRNRAHVPSARLGPVDTKQVPGGGVRPGAHSER